MRSNKDNTAGIRRACFLSVLLTLTPGTSRWHCEDAFFVVTSQVCVVVGNCDGFVGNRMLFKYMAEIFALLEEDGKNSMH